MSVFSEAIKRLEGTHEVRVFAPTGCWSQDVEKDKWLAELARLGERVLFVYGDAPDAEGQKLVDKRIALLRSGGVEVIKYPPQKDAHFGFIVFDNCALCGTSDGKYHVIENAYEVAYLRAGFDFIYERR